jgi:predicted helicase
VEAKDIPVNLNDKSLKEQFDRYRNSLDNLIITNYLTFRWYAKGELVEEIAIGRENNDVRAKNLLPLPENFGFFVTNKICDRNYTGMAAQYGAGLLFLLYIYPENFGQTEKVVNMNEANLNGFENLIGFVPAPEQIFDYIYAVLHSPTYRERYKEFLKIDFPRVPYPANAEQFKRLINFGEKLRKLHLMENIEPPKDVANFPVSGTNEIEKPEYNDNKAFINNGQ